jgi:hypothetical protein
VTTLQLKKALEQCVAGGRCEFMTYGDFGERIRIGTPSQNAVADQPTVFSHRSVQLQRWHGYCSHLFSPFVATTIRDHTKGEHRRRHEFVSTKSDDLVR